MRQRIEYANLWYPESFEQATDSLIAEITNGCGSAKAKFDFVPDNLLGLKIKPVCDIHDWMYWEGETNEDKEKADRVMLNNMLRLILIEYRLACRKAETSSIASLLIVKEKALMIARRRLAKRYYDAVWYFGGPAFWDGKTDGPR